MKFYAGAAFYDLEDVASDGSAVHRCVEINFRRPTPSTRHLGRYHRDVVTATPSTRFRDSRHTQVSFSQFEGKVCFAQNVASA